MLTIKQEDMISHRKNLGINPYIMSKSLGCSHVMLWFVETGKKRFGKTLHGRYTELFGAEILWGKPFIRSSRDMKAVS